jgi:DNA-binding MarR family transcriptional regulator
MAASRPGLSLRPSRPSGSAAATQSDLSRVLDSIRAIVRTLRLSGRAAEQSLGVNGAQLFVLQKLAEEPAESLAELASRTRTDPSSVSVVVSRLVARGLVSRESSAEDARRVTIALTPSGRGLLRRTPRNAQSQLLEAAASLPPRQLRGLADCLADLVEHMDADAESDGQRAPAPRVASRTRAARR